MIRRHWHIGTYTTRVRILSLTVGNKDSSICEETKEVETTMEIRRTVRLLRVAEHRLWTNIQTLRSSRSIQEWKNAAAARGAAASL